jgi:hypothetical protein
MIAAFAAFIFGAMQPASAPSAAACTASAAQRTTVEEIAAAPEQWAGRCVTIEGPASGTTIYSGIDGVYLAHRGPGGRAHGRAAARHRLGLYSRDSALRARFAGSPAVHLTVTGTVDTCARMQARADAARGDEIYVGSLGGFCHSFGGAVVHASTWVADPSRRYRRQAGEAARQRIGTYAPMPADWPHRPALEAFARDFLQALRSADREGLAALHGEDARSDEGGTLLPALLRERGGGWADIRRQAFPQAAIFVTAAEGGGAAPPLADQPEGLICFCRSGDCAQLWPISWGDADNAQERPYACTFVSPAEWVPRRAVLDTPRRSAWLPEPPQSAFRR